MGWPKSSFSFKVKIKDIFQFHFIELYRTMYSPFCSSAFWHFFQATSQFHLAKTFYLFEQRTVPGAFYSLLGNWNFFPFWEFFKDVNKWKFEDAVSGEYGGWMRTSQPICNGFCLVIKETWGRYLDGRLCVFCWFIPVD